MKPSCRTNLFLDRVRIAIQAITAVALAASMIACVPSMPARAYAADGTAGTITVGDQTTEYSTCAKLAHALEIVGSVTATVEMSGDWQKTTSTDGFPRLVIPIGANVTLNINGHMIDKALKDEDAPSEDTPKKNGEVILVMNGAKWATTRRSP